MIVLWFAIVAEVAMGVFGVLFQQIFESVAAVDAVVAVWIDEVSGIAVGRVVGDDDNRSMPINPRKLLFHPDPVGGIRPDRDEQKTDAANGAGVIDLVLGKVKGGPC